MNSSVAIRHDLVLVGGGHTHIQVLRSWAMDPPPGVRVTVVVDRPVAVHSGMVPGVKLVVVGAGAGGVELAFAFRARFEREGIRGASVALLEAGPTVLPGYPAAAVRGIEDNARARGIELRCGVSVARANADHLELEGGEIIPADALVWVTGAASLPLFDSAGLERDPAGFVRVRPTLQAVGHDEIFAVGDCARLPTDPNPPK